MDTNTSPTWAGCDPGNFSAGRHGRTLMALALHEMEGTLEGTRQYFNQARPAAPSSAHYGVGKDGAVEQYVKDEDEAYSNGIIIKPNTAVVPWLADVVKAGDNPNWYTLSIEMEGKHTWSNGVGSTVLEWWQPAEAQYQAVLALCRSLCEQHGIAIDRAHITRHSDYNSSMGPGGKGWCPGQGFNLKRLLGDLGDPEFAAYKSAQISPVAQTGAPFTPQIFGPASIDVHVFAAALINAGSPVIDERSASDYYAAAVAHGVDPNFALAQAAHEGQLGTAGVAAQTKNLCNLRPRRDGSIGRAVAKLTTPFGVFRRYDSWYAGWLDYLDLLVEAYQGMSIPAAIAQFAPAGDGANNPAAYTTAVEQQMYAWQQTSAGVK